MSEKPLTDSEIVELRRLLRNHKAMLEAVADFEQGKLVIDKIETVQSGDFDPNIN